MDKQKFVAVDAGDQFDCPDEVTPELLAGWEVLGHIDRGRVAVRRRRDAVRGCGRAREQRAARVTA